jgi:glycosyltransferase involved in cell wall biosynthesis
MNIWTQFVDQVIIVAPMESRDATAIDIQYEHSDIAFAEVPMMDLLSVKSILKSVLIAPKVFWQIYRAMKQADHIHLRCPGNIGLMGCMVQMLFPNKTKTAKYAGNWDPNAKQPWSYKLQKWILSNSFLTRNMQVLVYGEWEGSSKNIKPFFTASYNEKDKLPVVLRNFENEISFIFAGTLSVGKRPLYAVQLVEALYKKGYNVKLSLFGDGKERENIEKYILEYGLQDIIDIKGNQTQDILKNAYQESHFVLLPSKSEGWPKVIAEGMFWGCLPIATKVSCLGYMLDNGNRGLLLEMDLNNDVAQIISVLKDRDNYHLKVQRSIGWSRKYTLDLFANEIKGLLNS